MTKKERLEIERTLALYRTLLKSAQKRGLNPPCDVVKAVRLLELALLEEG